MDTIITRDAADERENIAVKSEDVSDETEYISVKKDIRYKEEEPHPFIRIKRSIL